MPGSISPQNFKSRNLREYLLCGLSMARRPFGRSCTTEKPLLSAGTGEVFSSPVPFLTIIDFYGWLRYNYCKISASAGVNDHTMKDAFGIDMKKWCREHEAFISENSPSGELLDIHRKKICILQHERLVHLIVTVMTVIAELFVADLVLLHPELGVIPAIVMLCLAVLLGFYFYHYFYLENTVQRWYRIADDMQKTIDRPD